MFGLTSAPIQMELLSGERWLNVATSSDVPGDSGLRTPFPDASPVVDESPSKLQRLAAP